MASIKSEIRIPNSEIPPRQRMDIVVIGHVDHGKSTLIGRLLADTGSLPEGKLDSVRELCRRTAKPFEYAFLLDALKDEQAQGITIDTARCFFKSAARDYIIIDAPGHLEFLKNMISGAARAEAGLLVIDAKEGVQENSRRHGYLMSLLGIRQIAVCVNKMDLVGCEQGVFDEIVRQYSDFLRQVGIEASAFIPISARDGDNIAARSARMAWYGGPAVLEAVDGFVKEPPGDEKPLRLPVQDIYKFTEAGDERRIVAGRIETGRLSVGDEVVFYPSLKRTRVAGIEAFNAPARTQAGAGLSTGITLQTQVYIRPGELVARADEPAPTVSSKLKATVFWLGRAPLIKDKRYKMKLAGTRSAVWMTDVLGVMDASTLGTDTAKQQVERHDVAQVYLETLKPVAFDLAGDIPQTGRFVIIDNYEIAGGGIITGWQQETASLAARHVQQREKAWDRSLLRAHDRASRYNQRATLVVLTGPAGLGKAAIAKAVEERLFAGGKLAYYLGLSNSLLGDDGLREAAERDEYLRRVGEISHLLTDAGLILLTAVSDLDDYELDIIRTLNQPNDLLVVNVGEKRLARHSPDLQIDSAVDRPAAVKAIQTLLQERNYLPEYYL